MSDLLPEIQIKSLEKIEKFQGTSLYVPKLYDILNTVPYIKKLYH